MREGGRRGGLAHVGTVPMPSYACTACPDQYINNQRTCTPQVFKSQHNTASTIYSDKSLCAERASKTTMTHSHMRLVGQQQ